MLLLEEHLKIQKEQALLRLIPLQESREETGEGVRCCETDSLNQEVETFVQDHAHS